MPYTPDRHRLQKYLPISSYQQREKEWTRASKPGHFVAKSGYVLKPDISGVLIITAVVTGGIFTKVIAAHIKCFGPTLLLNCTTRTSFHGLGKNTTQ